MILWHNRLRIIIVFIRVKISGALCNKNYRFPKARNVERLGHSLIINMHISVNRKRIVFVSCVTFLALILHISALAVDDPKSMCISF